MTQSPDPLSFHDWLTRLYDPEEVPHDELNAPMLRWLRGYFDVEGPTATDAVEAAFLTYLLALANDAAAAVLDDLHRTTAWLPVVIVERHDRGSVRISVNGGYTAPSMWELDRPEAFAEVADYIQAELASDPGIWPVCERHDVALHAEVHEGTAVWWCRLMRHSVAPVGSLGLVDRSH